MHRAYRQCSNSALQCRSRVKLCRCATSALSPLTPQQRRKSEHECKSASWRKRHSGRYGEEQENREDHQMDCALQHGRPASAQGDHAHKQR